MNLFKESFLYAIGYLFSRFQYFFILPFLLRKITVSDYGIVESLGVLQLFVLVLVVNNFDTSLSSYYYEDDKKQKNLEAVGFFSCLLNSSALVAVFIVFSSFFSKLILNSVSYKEEIVLAVGWALMNSLIHYNSFLLRLQKKIKQYSFLLIFQGLITLGLIYYFTVLKTFGVKGYLIGNLLGSFITWTITQKLVSYSFAKIDFKNNFLKLLRLAIPMFPVSIAAWSLTLIDRILLAQYSPGGLTDVGVYGFAVKMATLGSILWGPFQLAWMPFALSSFKKNNVIDDLEKAASWFFYLSYMVIILITFLSPIVVNIFFPAQYKFAVIYVGPLLLCNFFNIAYYLPYTSLIQMKKLYPVTIAFISASILNLILNLYLIPIMGIVGAVLANVVGYIIIFGITLFYSRVSNYPKYFKKEHFFTLGLVVLFLAINFIIQDSFWLRLGFASLSCMGITFIFYYFNMIEFKVCSIFLKEKYSK